MSLPKQNIDSYLGDGVYVSCDGYHLWLRTSESEEARSHRIALEPEVFRALMTYARQFGKYFTGDMSNA